MNSADPVGRGLGRIFLCLGLAFLALAVLLPSSSVARQEPESIPSAPLALLIANSDYRDLDRPTSGPGKNAQSLADELRRAGFTVDLHENLGRDAMRRVISGFVEKIKSGDTILFFFSGFGIQVKGSTYLMPVDADIWTEAEVVARAIELGEVTWAFEEAGAKIKLVVLDASRRNPFERRFRSLSAGLGAPALPRESLMISSADLGKVIDAGDGDSSIFIGELLKEMRAPDLTADEVFNRTRIGVSRATNGEQRPYVFSSLTEDFFFGPRRGTMGLAQRLSREGQVVPDRQRAFLAAPVEIGPPPGDAPPGTVFRDCDQCPEVVKVAAGEFSMGSDDFETERPIHPVVITKSFAVGRSEVTLAQWDACVADGGCGNYRPDDQGRGRTDLPASELSWRDAQAYADWLTRKTGHKYRLPTEAEWEYAARGGTATAFWWGDDPRAAFANCRGCGGGGRHALPVGSYQANPFGLVDTAGNVAEWVEDCWSESYLLASGDAGARQVRACKQRVVRGGSFDAGARYVRSASRFPYDADLRYYPNGFRVARDLP